MELYPVLHSAGTSTAAPQQQAQRLLHTPVQTVFEMLYTSRYARHGNYTCAGFKEIASGGYEALRRLKKRRNIKDRPKCPTPLEKREGCNHMTLRWL